MESNEIYNIPKLIQLNLFENEGSSPLSFHMCSRQSYLFGSAVVCLMLFDVFLFVLCMHVVVIRRKPWQWKRRKPWQWKELTRWIWEGVSIAFQSLIKSTVEGDNYRKEVEELLVMFIMIVCLTVKDGGGCRAAASTTTKESWWSHYGPSDLRGTSKSSFCIYFPL